MILESFATFSPVADAAAGDDDDDETVTLTLNDIPIDSLNVTSDEVLVFHALTDVALHQEMT